MVHLLIWKCVTTLSWRTDNTKSRTEVELSLTRNEPLTFPSKIGDLKTMTV